LKDETDKMKRLNIYSAIKIIPEQDQGSASSPTIPEHDDQNYNSVREKALKINRHKCKIK